MVELIELEEINKIYYMGKIEVPAIRDINLKIDKGEFVAIMGSSGCGKSTLLNMIGLLDTPTSGKILIDGIDTSTLNEDKRADFRLKKIGFIFQFFSLIMELKTIENIALPMIMNDQPYDNVVRLLKLVGVEKEAEHYPNELSGGQQQRVAIARALANRPEILLADEPTANLDSVNADKIVDLFKKLNEKGQTIVMVTHESELGKKTDRIIKIKDGRLIA